MTDTEILSCDGVRKHFDDAGHRLEVEGGKRDHHRDPEGGDRQVVGPQPDREGPD